VANLGGCIAAILPEKTFCAKFWNFLVTSSMTFGEKKICQKFIINNT